MGVCGERVVFVRHGGGDDDRGETTKGPSCGATGSDDPVSVRSNDPSPSILGLKVQWFGIVHAFCD